jgi:hypothetical protein
VTGSIYVQQVKDGICSAIRASVSAAWFQRAAALELTGAWANASVSKRTITWELLVDFWSISQFFNVIRIFKFNKFTSLTSTSTSFLLLLDLQEIKSRKQLLEWSNFMLRCQTALQHCAMFTNVSNSFVFTPFSLLFSVEHKLSNRTRRALISSTHKNQWMKEILIQKSENLFTKKI